MSSIFISHSNRDSEAASEIRRRLTSEGHRSVFLDFDPADGIPAGRNWEQELYAQLRACRAVVVICSAASMASDWVFAEITHARALGKPVFSIQVEDCEIRSLLSDAQVIDLSSDLTDQREIGFERLWRGLRLAGLDPDSAFDWDGSRPPYPGLLAFEEEDAAIFFGRGKEIGEGLSLLERLQRFGGTRWVLTLGASGSGKSSLVRAGLLPRLRRNGARWTLVGPLRPLADPFGQLGRSLAAAFHEAGEARETKELVERLTSPTSDTRAVALVALCNELRAAADHPRSQVLLVIDQLEELLASETGDENERFLSTLRKATELEESCLFVLGTLRSDFLGDFQNHPLLREMAFASLPAGPLSIDGFTQIVEGPAALAGIEVESGLVQALVADTETDDALPLLAFTLRELWEGASDHQRLTVSDYRERLGGLHGAVARAADTALGASRVDRAEEPFLRTAFLALARVDDEGSFVRRSAAWSELPFRSHAILERFVAARLLIAHGDGDERRLEVAHEALLRVWQLLVGWLDAARALFLWRKRLGASERQWNEGGRRAGYLLRGPALGEAAGWLASRPELLTDEEKAFIRASARSERWRRYRLLAFLGVVGVMLAIFAVRADRQRERAEKLRTGATDISKLTAARRMRQLAAMTPLKAMVNERAGRSLVEMDRPEGFLEMLDLDDLGPRIINISPDLMLVALRSDEGAEIHLVPERRWRLTLPHASEVSVLVIEGEPPVRRRGRRVLSASRDGAVHLWELPEVHGLIEAVLQQGDLQRVEKLIRTSATSLKAELKVAFSGHGGPVSEVILSPDGQYGASLSDAEVGLWRLASAAAPLALHGHEGYVNGAAFSPDGELLVTVGNDRRALVYEVEDVLAPPLVLRGHTAPVQCAAISLSGDGILTASTDREVRQWTRDGAGTAITTLDCDPLELKYTGTEGLAAVACADGTARILNLVSGEARTLS